MTDDLKIRLGGTLPADAPASHRVAHLHGFTVKLCPSEFGGLEVDLEGPRAASLPELAPGLAGIVSVATALDALSASACPTTYREKSSG